MTLAVLIAPLLLSIVALYSSLAIRSTLSEAGVREKSRKTSRTTLWAQGARCEHTVSNGNLVADSNAAVCLWSGVDAESSCCTSQLVDGACSDHCDVDASCCALYEHCVACCVREARLAFAACVARCRTHSGSAAAREFVDPARKHCFGLFNAPAPAFDRLFIDADHAAAAASSSSSRLVSSVIAVAIALPFFLR